MGYRGENDELALWRDFLSGNDGAFGGLFGVYGSRLISYGLTITADRELVKDCVQDIFIKMYRNRDTLENNTAIRYYLFVALRNALINKLSNRHTTTLSLEGFDPTEEPDKPDIRLEETESNLETSRKVSAILARLKPREREVIHYRYIEGMSIPDIALATGLNYQSVVNLISRTIKKLREET